MHSKYAVITLSGRTNSIISNNYFSEGNMGTIGLILRILIVKQFTVI